MMWTNCILWLATGAQLLLGEPNMPVGIHGDSGTFRIDFGELSNADDGMKSMAWAAGEWTRWECEHYVGQDEK